MDRFLILLRRRLKNKFAHPTPLGYRDVNSNIRVQLADDRKHLAEVQLNLRRVVEAKEIAHHQYEVIREALPKMCEGTIASGSPLMIACKEGHVDTARVLLDKGAEVDRAMNDGRTPLYIACENCHVDAARLLLEKGAAVDRAENDGRTSLWIACRYGHVDVARLLLDQGAEVDRAEENGATPLFAACFNGHVDAVRLLLDKGAEVDRAMEDGTTPLSIAERRGHSSIVALLEEHQK